VVMDTGWTELRPEVLHERKRHAVQKNSMEVSGGDGRWVDGAKTRSLARNKTTTRSQLKMSVHGHAVQ